MTDATAETSGAPRLAALKPRNRLTIGVTGHLPDRLGAGNVDGVSAAIDDLLAGIETVASSLAAADLRLVTSLAEGADSIAADAALVRGWTLDVVLPFFRDDYRRDFDTVDSREAYAAQLAAAGAVMELPGRRDEPEGSAYERAGRLVLAQSDILVAVWDGDPARGRGGAAQIVAEAVMEGVAVVHIDPSGPTPRLLWNRLLELDLGQQTVETVARGDLSALPGLVRDLLDPPAEPSDAAMLARFERPADRRWTLATGYPLLLAVMGVRRFRLTDIYDKAGLAQAAAPVAQLCSSKGQFATSLHMLLPPRFAQADCIATRAAQRFRSVYVTNFALAALAVIVSLSGLSLPPAAKPFLLAAELAIIGTILLQTRAGNRSAWHPLWLDNRALAERLRCLAISAQLGILDLRGGGDGLSPWVRWYSRATARQIGLPSATIDAAFLTCVRDDLMRLIDEQTGYLASDARRMHHLEHRLHNLGTTLFALTAIVCIALLLVKLAGAMVPDLDRYGHSLAILAATAGAALPAIGAAIYGIRMQGDFAGIAGRNHALGHHLATLARVIADDPLDFDTLGRRAKRATDLLTADLASWLKTYDARPLVLPG